MPIQPVEPRRLYQQIADQIRSLIAAGEFSPGSQLPAERELAVRFGVSRPSLREALIALEVEGRVNVRPGLGIVVTTPDGGTPNGAGDEGPLETLRARILIEGEIAAEAARLIQPADLTALEATLVALGRQAPDDASRWAADRQFHREIAAKGGNKVLLRMVTELFDQRNSPLARQFATDFDDAKTWAAVLSEHRRIVAALAARDPEQARKAMRDHLRKAHRRWSRDVENGRTKLPAGRRRVAVARDGLAPLD